jgi:hypothetical protein
MQVLVLVEGQCEEAFVKQVLRPRFDPRGLYFRPTIIETKKILSGGGFRGGVASFAQFRRHLVRLLSSAADERRFTVTTMLDYYQLPSDFPGMDSRPAGDARARVSHVEKAIHQFFGAPENFVPYLSLHEFEALLFTSDEAVPAVMQERGKSNALREIVTECGEPELINERPGCGPSVRLREIFPTYQKLLHGSLAVRRIDLDEMRAACGHFDLWLRTLEEGAGL